MPLSLGSSLPDKSIDLSTYVPGDQHPVLAGTEPLQLRVPLRVAELEQEICRLLLFICYVHLDISLIWL